MDVEGVHLEKQQQQEPAAEDDYVSLFLTIGLLLLIAAGFFYELARLRREARFPVPL